MTRRTPGAKGATPERIPGPQKNQRVVELADFAARGARAQTAVDAALILETLEAQRPQESFSWAELLKLFPTHATRGMLMPAIEHLETTGELLPYGPGRSRVWTTADTSPAKSSRARARADVIRQGERAAELGESLPPSLSPAELEEQRAAELAAVRRAELERPYGHDARVLEIFRAFRLTVDRLERSLLTIAHDPATTPGLAAVGILATRELGAIDTQLAELAELATSRGDAIKAAADMLEGLTKPDGWLGTIGALFGGGDV